MSRARLDVQPYTQLYASLAPPAAHRRRASPHLCGDGFCVLLVFPLVCDLVLWEGLLCEMAT
jgi:hypothetical protein